MYYMIYTTILYAKYVKYLVVIYNTLFSIHKCTVYITVVYIYVL